MMVESRIFSDLNRFELRGLAEPLQKRLNSRFGCRLPDLHFALVQLTFASPAGRAGAALARDQLQITSQPGKSIRLFDKHVARAVTERSRQVHALVIRPGWAFPTTGAAEAQQ